MGDRSNIAIESTDYNTKQKSRVYLYAHWDGADAILNAAHGLRSGRLGDDAYLTRVIFSKMVANDIEGETGYGISPRIGDSNYPVIVIDGDDPKGATWIEDDNRAQTVLTRKVSATEFLQAVDALGNNINYDSLIAKLK